MSFYGVTLAQFSVALITLCLTWRVAYNRYLHPLRHYPGPLFAAVSRIPYAKAYLQGTLHKGVAALHDQYGDVVRIAPDELSYRGEHAWEDIYSRSSNFAKDMRFYQTSGRKAPSVVIAPDGVHQRQKKAILRAFTGLAIRDHEKVLQPYVNILVEKLQVHCKLNPDSPTDMTAWFNYVMFDFMAHELFGEALGCLENAAYHPWVDMLFGSIKAWAILTVPKFFPSAALVVKPLVYFLSRNTLKHRDTKHKAIAAKIVKLTQRQHQNQQAIQSSPQYFMDYIQKSTSEDSKSVLLPEEILPNSSFLMMAGSETTATLLSGATFHLLKQRATYEKLVPEIRIRFSSMAEISFASVVSLPYLQRVLQEALRMYPPLPLGMPRVVPAGGAVIDGGYVPEKTSVAVSSWSAYRSASNFSKADTFLPERWAEGTLHGATDKKSVLQPFSLGPRGCPGKSLAVMEASMILAKLLWAFDIHLAPECDNWDEQRAFIIWEKGPLLVRLVPRC
ncbi:hypothetical protein BDV06DRAFT_81820 [Aspergillus oleicola]